MDAQIKHARTRTESDSMGKIEVPSNVVLGRPDAAFAASFRYWARHHAAGTDPRVRHAEKGRRAGE